MFCQISALIRRIRPRGQDQVWPERYDYPCDDCGMLTAPAGGAHEWYMVEDAVWQEAGATASTILCIGCVERRLGRTLSRRDFPNVMLNDVDFQTHTKRLAERLRRDDLP